MPGTAMELGILIEELEAESDRRRRDREKEAAQKRIWEISDAKEAAEDAPSHGWN